MDRLLITVFLLGAIPAKLSVALEAIVTDGDQDLDVLSSRVLSLSDKLDAVLEKAERTKFGTLGLTKTLDVFEGKRGPCKNGFFPCGYGPDGAVQCVRDYLVCDNYKDCKNGADEAPDVCKLPIKVPDIISPGNVIRDHCKTLGRGVPVTGGNVWTITKLDVLPWFPSRPSVTWDFEYEKRSQDAEHDNSMVGISYYDYSTGDFIVPWFQPLNMVGRCVRVPVSPEKSHYRCDLDVSDGAYEEKKEHCWLVTWTVPN